MLDVKHLGVAQLEQLETLVGDFVVELFLFQRTFSLLPNEIFALSI